MLHKGGSNTGIKDKPIKFTLSAGTDFIGDFNTQLKVAILQQRRYWEALQIKDLKLIMAKHYTFMVKLKTKLK